MIGQPSLAPLLEGFFTQRLMRQRRASAHTIASYRDTFRLLLRFVQQRLRKPPSVLMLDDIDAPLVVAFLDDLEAKRGITARTRNLVPFVSRPEVDAMLAAPDLRTWSGRRDHALILLAVQTGLRLSELTGLLPDDLQLGAGAHVRVIGKGRKVRCTPLSKSTRPVLTAWTREPSKVAEQPVLPNAQGGRLSAHGVQYLLAKHVAAAAATCPSLARKRMSPHVLRHTTAMDLLQEGVDRSVIALWLGHESIETTQIYLDADLELKQRVLDRTTPPTGRPGRYRPRQASGLLERAVARRPMFCNASTCSEVVAGTTGHRPALAIVQFGVTKLQLDGA